MRAGTLALSVVLLAAQAQAQDAEVEALLQQGAAARREQREEEALGSFERAWARCRCDEAMAQRAFAEQAIGRWGEAAEHLAAVASSEDPWILRNRGTIDTARTRIAREVGTLEVRANVATARVWIAGRERGAPRVFFAPRGEITVRVEAPGYLPESRVVTISPDVPARLEVTLVPQAVAPLEVPPPPPIARPRPTPIVASRRWRPWVWAAGGVSLLAVGGAAAALWAREESIARYNDPSCVTVFASREERCGAYRDAATVNEALAATGFVLGGAAAVTAVVLALVDGQRNAERAWICGATGARSIGCGVRF